MQRWVRALWVWWLLCGLMMLALWLLATRNGLAEMGRERQQHLALCVSRIGEKLANLQVLPEKALRDPAVSEAQLAPFFHLYRLDSEACPGWIREMLPPVLARQGLTQLRPLPPGLGRLDAPLAADAPSSYWLVARPDGTVASLDLNFLFGPWLDKQLGDLGVQVRHLSPQETWANPPGLVRTLFAQEAYPFDGLILKTDDRAVTRAYLIGQFLWLALGVMVLIGFAAALRLAARGIRSQWDLVEARRHFNALVSHELRTPVSALRMYSEILQNGWVDDAEKIRAYHQIMATESARLQHLVENLLGIGSLESGRTRFESRPVQVNDLLRDLVAQRNWQVEWELDPKLPEVKGDREALTLIFGNLIENGLRHGGGQVTVRTQGGPSEAVVEIRDRGPGVAVADRQRIFEAYQRQSQAPGVGLGLALVKSFLEAQSGRVEVLSREGGGAVFRVTFPA